MGIKKGQVKEMVCKATKKKVKMVYVGKAEESGVSNGHPGWMCLHDEEVK